MITAVELDTAISECLSDPTTGTKRSVLADLIIIQNYLYGGDSVAPESGQGRSIPPPVDAATVNYDTLSTDCSSTFLAAVDNKPTYRVLHLIDELLDGVKILHPRMYDVFIQKINDI